MWLRRCGKKIIYDFDDAIMYDARDAQTPDRKRKKAFQRTVKLADMVIAGNSYLAEHAREFNSNVAVIPTGLDTSAYKVQVSPIKDGKIRLVWIGSSSTLRYLAEIKTALEEIGSRLDNVILRIICDEFLDLKNMKVEKVQWSFQNQAIDLVASDIGLAPLPDNAFTRGKCGFKILQYAAAGLPTVASPVGVNAEYASNGVTGFHATNTAEWITSISRLIENAELRKTMGRQARLWVTSFDVDIIGKRLIGMIEESIKSDEYHDKDRP
jgi:glycosyltransferase involved in cell wall biosynthesis